MASGPHTFVTLSVFSPERFQGNPLAIVAVRGNALSQQRKSLIAKEFGYSETVFIHDAPGPGLPRRVDIFTEKGEELPFAGHPVIGVAHYLFVYCEPVQPRTRDDPNQQLATSIMTKAGLIPIQYNSYRQVAACSIPHDVHLHSTQIKMDDVISVQPQVRIVPTYENCKDKSFPVMSIVKGMTFALIDLTDAPEVLAGLSPAKAPEVSLDEAWGPSFVGALYYKKKQVLKQASEPTIYTIQARMITQGWEDPGTGSACCTLACYLALYDDEAIDTATSAEDKLVEQTASVKLEDTKVERRVYAITQGVEMGRTCTIAVEVDTKTEQGKRSIAGVTLSGRACFFMQGELLK